MMDTEQFYPTPKGLAKELIGMMDLTAISTVLEPSAGTGALLEALDEAQRYCGYSCHCIESNEERRATLKGKDFPVVWDDFLTFDTLFPYSAILMNPPFHDGTKHLMKALGVCAPGGQIACILNAETIKNPCTKERKALLAKIEAQEKYNIEFRECAFSHSERPSKVEVALVYVKMKSFERCITFEHFKKRVSRKQKTGILDNPMTRYGEIPQLIDHYRAEVKTALALFDELMKYNRISLEGLDKYADSVFDIKVKSVDGDKFDMPSNIVRKINHKYWTILLYSKELSSLLTEKVQREYSSKLVEMAEFEFNERNILQMKEDLSRNLLHNVEDAIMDVWEEFTSRYSYTDYSKNIHYYNGWRTNNAYKCNKKIILPLYAFSSWSGKFEPSYSICSRLADIEKVMNYLDCGRTESANMYEKLRMAEQTGQNRNIDTKYFTVTCYKKGTCHLVFKDLDLLKKFNLYCGRKKKWLPDDYGRKPYSCLDEEEKTMVEEFEGRASYEDTYQNQGFYLPDTSSLLMLNSPKVA